MGFSFVGLFAVWLVMGCAKPDGVPVPEGLGQQIIVKFTPGVDPRRAGFMEILSEAVETQLVYVRPMSGEAHVVRASSAGDPKQMRDLIRRLTSRPDVVYAEPDRPVRPYEIR
jgi:hypothetical protein